LPFPQVLPQSADQIIVACRIANVLSELRDRSCNPRQLGFVIPLEAEMARRDARQALEHCLLGQLPAYTNGPKF
jgi:hypothetical protein